MRPGQTSRPYGRNNGNNSYRNRQQIANRSQTLDSNGPNVKIRGTPHQLSVKRPALSRRHARWGRPYFQQFFGAMPPKPASFGAVSLFKFRRIEHLVVAAITELVVHRALPLMSGFEKRVSLTGDRGFESGSLQGRVCEPSVPESPRLRSPHQNPDRRRQRLCAVAWRPGRQRRAGCFKIAPTGGNISIAPYSGTAAPPTGSARMRRPP